MRTIQQTLTRIVLICTILIVVLKLNAQTPNTTWANAIGSTTVDQGRAVATDVAGNVYTTGYFSGTVDFDPSAAVYNLTSAGGNDIFVYKLDANGNFLWAKAMGSTGTDIGYGIAVDAAGNVYTTGYFNGTVDFDPSAAVYNLTSAGSSDIFVCKLDANGGFVWAKSMGSTNGDIGFGIAIDAAGNVYTTGYFQGTGDFDASATTYNLTSAGVTDIFVSKLDANGGFVWAKALGGTNGDVGYGIAIDAVGNVYTTGYFQGTADFDPSATTYNITTAGSNDIFVSKLDANGGFVWAKSMGSTVNDIGYGIAVDAAGNVYTTGYFQGTVDFDASATTYNLTSAGGTDIFVSKLDANGGFVWAKALGGTNGDVGYGIAIDAVGNVYTTGSFNGTADFDPSATTYNLTSAGSTDIFVSKLDANGGFVWAKAMGSSINDVGYGIAVNAAGNVYTTGYFSGTADFNPSGTALTTTSAANSQDIFVAKIATPNTAPTFSNATNTLNVCQNAAATSINSLLQVMDADASQIEAFTVITAPNHGGSITTGTYAISFANTPVSPTGWSYTPANGYSGTETFTIQVSDGNGGIVSKMITVTVKATSTSTTPVTVCNTALPYTWNGTAYNAAGTYTKTFTNAVGCDSVASLVLTVNQALDNIGLDCSNLPATAFSVRLLRSTYTGFAIQVRRSNDNATQNIGFVNGNLDTATLKTFVGSNSAFVSIWYDQSGNGVNLTQTTTFYQPRIVKAGVIERDNTKPTIRFLGTVGGTRNALELPQQSTNGQIIVVNNFNGGTDGFLLGHSGVYNYHSDNPNLFSSAHTSNSVFNATIFQNGISKTGTTAVYNTSLGINSVAPQTPNVGTEWDNIGSDRVTLHNTTNGTYSELITFSTALSNVYRTAVEQSQSDYYNICITGPTSSTTNVSICPSALPYSWNGNRTAAGTYTFTTTTSKGCDSVATLNLTIKTTSTSTTNVSICPSALPYSWNGSRTTAGTYTATLTNSQGCDSVATLNLTVKTNTTSTTNTSICPSALPYSWNGSRAAAGTYTFTTTNSVGCDSVATLVLTVKATSSSSTPVSVCSNSLPYTWNGTAYNAAGTYTKNFTNAVGCDSVATLVLTVNQSPAIASLGNALYFSNASYNVNYVSFNSSFNTATNYSTASNFTIESWINPSDNGFRSFFSHKTSGGNADGYALFVNPSGYANKLYLEVANNGFLSTGSLTAGQWNHVALSYAAGVATWYINGVASGSASINITTNGGPTILGVLNGGNYEFNGGMDEVRIWNTVRTQAEIAANMNTELAGNEAGLYAYYNFNQGIAGGNNSAVTTLFDKTANTNNGTLNLFSLSGSTSNFVSSYSASSQSVCLGSSATSFSPTVTGATSYQWYSNTIASNTGGSIIGAATSASYTAPTTIAGTKYYYLAATNASGCSATSSVQTITVKATSTSTSNVTICSSALPYSWNGSRASAGTYTFTTTNSVGCDSVATLNLTVNQNPVIASAGNALNFTANSSVTFNQPFTTATDNFTLETWVNWNGQTTTQNGGWMMVLNNGNAVAPHSGYGFQINTNNGKVGFVMAGIAGADCSVITPNTWYHLALVRKNGVSTLFVNGVPDANVLNDGPYTPAITARMGLFGFAGSIDEVRMWNLAKTQAEIQAAMNTTLQGNESNLAAYYNFNQGIAAGNNSGVTTLIDGTLNANNGTLNNFNLSGSTSNWITNTNSVTTYSASTQSICIGSSATSFSPTVTGAISYQWFSNTAASNTGGSIISAAKSASYTAPTTIAGTKYYYLVATNASGCSATSSVQTITVKATSTSTANVTICSSELPYSWNGLTFNVAGSQTATLTNAAGCDSLATLNLTVNEPTNSTTTANICVTALPYNWNGVNYNSGGSYTIHLTNAAGCDSAATLNLTIKAASSSITNLSICSGILPYSWNGLTFNTAGSKTATLTNAAGCDSAATLNLSVSNTTSSTTTIVSCGNYTWNGTTYTTSGTYNKQFTGVGGCDSIATLNLTVVSTLPSIAGLDAVCVGSTITLSNAVAGGVWFTNFTSRVNVNAATGLVTAKSAGTITIQYSKTDCGSITKTITINPIPVFPTINYALGTVNPQYGAPSGSFCSNKIFTVEGTPTGGVWSKTGVISVTSPAGVVSTGNTLGAGSLIYTITVNGCSSSRTIAGSVVACAARGVNTVDGQLSSVDGFTMYPNPAKSVVSLLVDQLMGSGTIVITDLYGKAIKTQTLSMGNNTIDIANLSKGMYFVSTITSNGKTTKKLVVE